MGDSASSLRQRSDQPRRAILLMVVGTFFIAVNDATMKWILADIPVPQAIFLRALFCFPAIAFMARQAGGWSALRVEKIWGQLLGAVLLVVALFQFITSLSHLTLSIATIMVYTSPLFLTALAPLILREKVGWRRYGAVAFGFAGTLLIIQPGGANFSWILLLPLSAAFCSAVRDAVTRRLVSGESSVAILAVSNVAIMVTALPFALIDWQPVPPGHFLLFALAGLAFGLGVYFITETLRFAEASLTSPYRYAGVVWAIILGVIIWQDPLDLSILAGMALIVGSGLFILWRERVRSSQDP